MNNYVIKFKIDGEWETWVRQGNDMEATLANAKEELAVRNGGAFNGGICIYGEQGDREFNFSIICKELQEEFDEETTWNKKGEAFILLQCKQRDGLIWGEHQWINEASLKDRRYVVTIPHDYTERRNSALRNHISVQLIDTKYNPKTRTLERPLRK